MIGEIIGYHNFYCRIWVVFNPSYSYGVCEWCRNGKDNFCRKIGVLGTDGPGGFAEYIVASGKRIYRLPDCIPDYRGVLSEPLSVAVHAVRVAGVKSGDNVAVLGGGAVGLLSAAVARVGGAHKVMVLEEKEFRVDVATELGFISVDCSSENVIERVMDETSGEGADVVIEATGSPAVAGMITSITKRGGSIVIVGIQKQPAPVDLRSLVYNELKLYGSFIYVPRDFNEAVSLITSGKIAVESRLVTHELPLERGEEAIHIAENAPDSLKVVINCDL